MIVLSIVLIIVSVLLILAVLSQNSKGGGLSGQFGGNAGTSQILGAKRTGDFLERATWVLITLLILITFVSSKAGFVAKSTQEPKSVLEHINDDAIGLDENLGLKEIDTTFLEEESEKIIPVDSTKQEKE